jgi:DnaJ-class molecular chaperone
VLLWQDYSFSDPGSAQVLEAYLDRRHPTWRDDLERTNGTGETSEHDMRAPQQRGMTRAEALEILGLEEGAGDDAVRTAHRELMKKLHPDRGGSNYLASKINEAKVVLIGD